MRLTKLISVLFIIIFLSGCMLMAKNQEAAPAPAAEAPAEAPVPSPVIAEEGAYAIVRIFYSTDRKMVESIKPAARYTAERGELTYGTCDVSIPRDHKMGELESPSLLRFEFREDPEKHVVLLEVKPKDKKSYFMEISEKLKTSKSDRILVFVHGYNVTFEDAARRTAQITYDIGFEGAPILYSWPSQGKLTSYITDETNIEWSKINIKHFLNDLLTKTSSKSIYLIAHSMGNRGLTRALGEVIASNPEASARFKEIILAAPDIDADVFKNDIAPQMVNKGSDITLYASSKDVALMASRTLHGGYKRIGDLNDGIFIASGIDTLDASNVDTSLFGHSYIAERRSILSDIFHLINERKRPKERFGLKPVSIPSGTYWVIKE